MAGKVGEYEHYHGHMMKPHEELFALAATLETAADPPELQAAQEALARLDEAAREVGRAFSGSWLGYHSRVYYDGFVRPPPGAHFSQEWGLMELLSDMGTKGNWREFDPDDVKAYIQEKAGEPDLEEVRTASGKSAETFERLKSEIASILSAENETGADTFIAKLQEDLASSEPLSSGDIAQIWSPKGQVMTRDTTVIGQGNQVPPHLAVRADVASINQGFNVCRAAAEVARKAASHLERKARGKVRDSRVGTNVFIGHGRSNAWRELKDFVQDRLGLPWDEFNRVPVAGITNIARLSEMLDSAAVALVLMTAEDETSEGQMRARMNVIHEVGLFQGRLGFTRAIVLLEEGCEQFTNIEGLGQIRFPTGNISAAFEEVRHVLEREGLVSS
jgi:predicted nucleotide-binding protein